MRWPGSWIGICFTEYNMERDKEKEVHACGRDFENHVIFLFAFTYNRHLYKTVLFSLCMNMTEREKILCVH